MFSWLKRKPKRPFPTRVACDEHTVQVFAGPDEIASFRWSELECIRAWKIDALTVDCICLAFEVTGSDRAVCVHEEVEGYQSLVEQMQRRCTGYREDWWQTVAFPAFAETHTLIWRKGDRQT